MVKKIVCNVPVYISGTSTTGLITIPMLPIHPQRMTITDIFCSNGGTSYTTFKLRISQLSKYGEYLFLFRENNRQVSSAKYVHETIDYLNSQPTNFNFTITNGDDTAATLQNGFNLAFNIEFSS